MKRLLSLFAFATAIIVAGSSASAQSVFSTQELMLRQTTGTPSTVSFLPSASAFASYRLIYPITVPTVNQFLSVQSISGNDYTLTWASAGAGSSWLLTGNASTDSALNFLGTTDARSLVFRTGNTPRVKLFATGGLQLLSSGGNAQRLYFQNPAGTFSTAFRAGAQTVNLNYTLPISAPANNQVLISNSSGVMSWANAGSIAGQTVVKDSAWTLFGNLSTNPAVNFLGTRDNQPMVIRTNNIERMRIFTSGGVAIGTATDDASALLNLTSTTKGLLLPRLTFAQRNAISSPSDGLLLYQSDNSSGSPQGFYGRINGNWVALPGWSLTGNAGTDPIFNFLGTTDAKDLSIRTNGTGRILVKEGTLNIQLVHTSANMGRLELKQSSPTGYKIGTLFGTAPVDSLTLGVNNGTAIAINLNNRVGIGTLLPAERLDVNGNVRFTNALMPGGTAGTSGQVLLSQGAGVTPIWSSSFSGVAIDYWNRGTGALSLIGLGSGNTADAQYAIAAGRNNTINSIGEYSTIIGGQSNNIQQTYAFIGGGQTNTVTAAYGVIAGGQDNSITSNHSFIGSGFNNFVGTNYSAIAAGQNNSVAASYSFVGAGQNNSINGSWGVVVGGNGNVLQSNGTYGVIAGGQNNQLKQTHAVISGGINNIIETLGNYSAIVGGRDNTVDGQYSMAFGYGANVAQDNSIVFTHPSAATNDTKLGIRTNAPSRALDVNGDVRLGANGTTISNVIKATVNADVPSVAANSSITFNFTVTNAAVGSTAMISPANDLGNGLIIAHARVSAANTVQVRFQNVTGGAVDPAIMDWFITVIQ